MIGEGGGGEHASSPEMQATGSILEGRYRIGRLLRAGGMGSVYEGEHTATGRRVALKLVHLRSAEVSDAERRFEREARIASNVHSKHIVQVFDAGRDPVHGPFIAMELLQGEDLEEHLARNGPLPVMTACQIAYQAARGLEKAHAANVAHRDLKPGNLFLGQSDEEDLLVKVLDFGIAKLFDDEGNGGAKLTRDGSALGTPLYMSPEQARGCLDIDGRTDVYSLGAVLYEMIVGHPHVPELPNFNQLVIHIATVPAPRLSASVPWVDPRLDQLVADMLVSDRRDRLPTIRAVREQLRVILGGTASFLAEGSGSFAARAPAAPAPPPSHSGELSASTSSVHTVPPSGHGDDSEEVHFFDRGSLPSEPVAVAAQETPDSEGEPIALFDRASLQLPAVNERTSSGAHVVDAAATTSSPVLLRSAPIEVAPPSPPIAIAETGMKAGSRRFVGLLAAGAVLIVFVTLGSVRVVTSRAFPATASPASPGGVAAAGGAAAPEATEVPRLPPPTLAPLANEVVPDAGPTVPARH